MAFTREGISIRYHPSHSGWTFSRTHTILENDAFGPNTAAGSGAISFAGSGTGKTGIQGNGGGSVLFAGSGTAEHSYVAGLGSGALLFAGSGAGAVEVHATGGGGLGWDGAGTAGSPARLTVELLEGVTVIATWLLDPDVVLAQAKLTLSGPEFAAIGDWSNLRLRLTHTGSLERSRVTETWLEMPLIALLGHGGGAILWAGTGLAAILVQGAGSGAVLWLGSGTARTTVRGHGGGAVLWQCSGSGTLPVETTGGAHISWLGSGQGIILVRANGSGAILWSAAGVASAPAIGIGSGAIDWIAGGFATVQDVTYADGLGAWAPLAGHGTGRITEFYPWPRHRFVRIEGWPYAVRLLPTMLGVAVEESCLSVTVGDSALGVQITGHRLTVEVEP